MILQLQLARGAAQLVGERGELHLARVGGVGGPGGRSWGSCGGGDDERGEQGDHEGSVTALPALRKRGDARPLPELSLIFIGGAGRLAIPKPERKAAWQLLREQVQGQSALAIRQRMAP